MLFTPALIFPQPASAFLLDSLSATAVIAYSSRKLRSAYAGNALQVRRSSDNTTQNIGFSGGDLDTTSLATFVGANNGFVTTWYDQAGSTNGTQATAAQQPQIVASGTNITQNTHVALKGTNAASTLLACGPSVSQAQPFTIAFGFKYNTTPVQPHLMDTTIGGSTRVLFGESGGTAYDIFAGLANNPGGTLDTSAHCGIVVYDNANSTLIIDGSTTIASGTAIGTDSFGSLQMIFGTGQAGGISPDSTIFEFILFSGTMGSTDRATIRSSWQSYWGTP